MTRSPLAYPLNRSADTDVGGAADLQTDIMRFMAILSLCLVAIFALVQSIPLTPASVPPVAETEPVAEPVPVAEPTPVMELTPVAESIPVTELETIEPEVTETVALTRPKWTPRYQARDRAAEPSQSMTIPKPVEVPDQVEIPEAEGFTLRFESDAALTRAVAANYVGLYAIENSRAQRMTVSESRISFWDASTPNTFHEMEPATVPGAVIDALSRTGTRAETVSWGVTLPGKLKADLDALMQAHRGGLLVIGASGQIRWEAS